MYKYRTPVGIDYIRYTTERTNTFTGRAWIFALINAWLVDVQSSQVLLLTGEPGSGKTAIASRLYQYAAGVHHTPEELEALKPGFLSAVFFCSAADRRWINPHVFTETLALQFASRYPLFAQALLTHRNDERIQISVNQSVQHMLAGEITGVLIEHLDLGVLNVEDAFVLAIREPLEVLCASEDAPSILVLIDALDEAALYEGNVSIIPLLIQARFLPKSVRFVLTMRPDLPLLESLQGSNITHYSLSSGQGALESYKDIRQHIQETLQSRPDIMQNLPSPYSSTQFIDTLEQKSQGNFLYSHYALDMILHTNTSISLELVQSLPATLDRIYQEYLRRLTNDSDVWVERYAPVLGILAVAQEGLSRDEMALFLGIKKEALNATLKKCRQLLDVDETLVVSQRRYMLYHRSFADFLLDEDRSVSYWCDGSNYHSTIAQYYLSSYTQQWTDCPEYGRRYLAIHIDAAPEQFQHMHVIQALKQLSDYLLESDPRSADTVTRCTLNLAKQLPNEPLAMALAHWARGNWETNYHPDDAIDSYEQAALEYSQANDFLAVGRISSNLVVALVYCQRLDEAQAMYQRAWRALEQAGKPALSYILNLEVNYGLLLIDQQEYEHALTVCNNALALAEKQGEVTVATTIQINQSIALMLSKNYEESEKLLLQTREKALKQNYLFGVARTLRNLGELYWYMGKQSKAIDMLQQARKQFETLGNEIDIREIDDIINKIHHTFDVPS